MRRIVPIDLGGSPNRCSVAPERRTPWDSESLLAMVDRFHKRFPGEDLEIGFFHGGFPDESLLTAATGYPLRLSCHPADLSREQAERFRNAGGRVIEIEAMTLDPYVLRTCHRQYRVDRIRGMAKRLRETGFQVGLHLVPGLPGQDREGAISDAESLTSKNGPWIDFVRIWPAIAFAGSKLADWVTEGRWEPMDVEEAIDLVQKMVEICDRQGVPVARIGIQPGQDIPVRAVAGPVHPNMRGEVEARRFAQKLQTALAPVKNGTSVIVAVNPKDLHLAKGTSNINARQMKTRYALQSMEFQVDNTVRRGTVRIARVK